MSRVIRFLPEESNPYAPPSAPATSPATPELPELRLFLRWEKLRLLYNAFLGVEAILLMIVFPPRDIVAPYLGWLAVGCFFNLCFCVGPVLDGYARLIGLRHPAVTGVIFGLGTTFAAIILGGTISMGRFGAD